MMQQVQQLEKKLLRDRRFSMAIDTRQKRMSMLNMFGSSLQPRNLPMFEADGTVDLDDKQHLLGLYSGIAFAAPGGVTVGLYYYTMLMAGGK